MALRRIGIPLYTGNLIPPKVITEPRGIYFALRYSQENPVYTEFEDSRKKINRYEFIINN